MRLRILKADWICRGKIWFNACATMISESYLNFHLFRNGRLDEFKPRNANRIHFESRSGREGQRQAVLMP